MFSISVAKSISGWRVVIVKEDGRTVSTNRTTESEVEKFVLENIRTGMKSLQGQGASLDW